MRRKKHCTQCGKPFSSAACGFTHLTIQARMQKRRQIKPMTGWVVMLRNRRSLLDCLAEESDGTLLCRSDYSVYYMKRVAMREAETARAAGWDVKVVKVTVVPEEASR